MGSQTQITQVGISLPFFLRSRDSFHAWDTAEVLGTLSTDDDEPRGRRPEVKFPLTALLRMLDSSSTWRLGRQNGRFAVLNERD